QRGLRGLRFLVARALPSPEDELALLHVDLDGVALPELAVEHPQRQRIEAVLLDRPLERTGAVDRVVGDSGKALLRRLGHLPRTTPTRSAPTFTRPSTTRWRSTVKTPACAFSTSSKRSTL